MSLNPVELGIMSGVLVILVVLYFEFRPERNEEEFPDIPDSYQPPPRPAPYGSVWLPPEQRRADDPYTDAYWDSLRDQ